MASLFNYKHHVPIENAKSIREFLLNEWYSIYDYKAHANYFNREIMSDRHIYTGRRYKNIFEMRKIKAHYFLHDLPSKVSKYFLVRYEDILTSPLHVLTNISRVLKLDLPAKPILRFDYKPTNQGTKKTLKEEYSLDKDVLDIIKSHIDWKVEEELGYVRNSTSVTI